MHTQRAPCKTFINNKKEQNEQNSKTPVASKAQIKKISPQISFMNIFFGSPLKHDRREYNKKIENNKKRQWQSTNNVSHRKALSEAFFSLQKNVTGCEQENR